MKKFRRVANSRCCVPDRVLAGTVWFVQDTQDIGLLCPRNHLSCGPCYYIANKHVQDICDSARISESAADTARAVLGLTLTATRGQFWPLVAVSVWMSTTDPREIKPVRRFALTLAGSEVPLIAHYQVRTANVQRCHNKIFLCRINNRKYNRKRVRMEAFYGGK